MKHQLICNYAKINSARKYEFGQCAKINGAKINRAKIGGARKKMGLRYIYIIYIYVCVCVCMYAYVYIRTKIHNGGNYAHAHV